MTHSMPWSRTFWAFSTALLGCSSPSEETSSSSHFSTCTVNSDCAHLSASSICVDSVCVETAATAEGSNGDTSPSNGSPPDSKAPGTESAATEVDPASSTEEPSESGAPSTAPPPTTGNPSSSPSSSCPPYAAIAQQMRFGTDAVAGVAMSGKRYVLQGAGEETRVFTSEGGPALTPAAVLGTSEATVWGRPGVAVEFEDAAGTGTLRAQLSGDGQSVYQFDLQLFDPQGTYEEDPEGEHLQQVEYLAADHGVVGAGRARDGTIFVLDAADGKLRLFYSEAGTLLRTAVSSAEWAPNATVEQGALRLGFGGPPGYAFLLVEFDAGEIDLRLQETGPPAMELATPDPSAPGGWVRTVLLPSRFGDAVDLGEDLALEAVDIASLEELTMCPQEVPIGPWDGIPSGGSLGDPIQELGND